MTHSANNKFNELNEICCCSHLFWTLLVSLNPINNFCNFQLPSPFPKGRGLGVGFEDHHSTKKVLDNKDTLNKKHSGILLLDLSTTTKCSRPNRSPPKQAKRSNICNFFDLLDLGLSTIHAI